MYIDAPLAPVVASKSYSSRNVKRKLKVMKVRSGISRPNHTLIHTALFLKRLQRDGETSVRFGKLVG